MTNFSLRLCCKSFLLTVTLGLSLLLAGGMMHNPIMEVPNNGTEAYFVKTAQAAQDEVDRDGLGCSTQTMVHIRACSWSGQRAFVGGVGPRMWAENAHHPPVAMQTLLQAIRQVESGGNDRAVGDGGKSRGLYQCGRAVWRDGGGNPADYDRLVWDRAATERVMLAYWTRYGATTDEQRARMWNGGPTGMNKRATVAYWNKVKHEMER